MSASAAAPRSRRIRRVLRAFFGGFLLLGLTVLTLGLLYMRNSRTPDVTVPTPAVPADNAYNDFVRAGKLAGKMAHRSPYDMAGTTAQNCTYANYKACATDAVPTHRAVQAGLKKAYLCPPVRSLNAVQFPQYALFRETARTLAGKAGYEAISGQSGQAADTLLDILEESAMIPRGGSLVTGLVALACESICIRPLESLIPKLNEAELAHVAKRFDAIAAKRVPYADLIAEDGNQNIAFVLEIFRKPSKGGLPFNLQDLTGSSGGTTTWQDRLAMLQIAFTSKEAFVKHQQDYFKALTAESRQPYAGASKIPINRDPLLNVMASVYANSRQKFVSMEAVEKIIRVEVALELYKRAHNRYPAELAQLAPAYLTAIPLDPCINAPLRYQPAPDGRAYVLYSVGADQTDDHALPQKSPGDGSRGDLVARHFWKPFSFIPPVGK